MLRPVPAEVWLEDVINTHDEEALQRVDSPLLEIQEPGDGCSASPGPGRRKVRFKGGQTRAYRFVYALSVREAGVR